MSGFTGGLTKGLSGDRKWFSATTRGLVGMALRFPRGPLTTSETLMTRPGLTTRGANTTEP